MAGEAGTGEVAEALAITTERECAGGGLWCPAQDGAVLRHWITDRPAALGGGIRRLVRLARLMSAAGGGDYSRFLYIRLPALRAAHFQQALRDDQARLRQIAAITPAGAVLGEPAMAVRQGGGEGFAIDFAQMPRLAALIDVLHNGLGFGTVLDMLAPVLGSGPPDASADDVARTLHAALNAWLAPRLGSTNHARQAQQIRAFLARRGRITPGAIDDDAILHFWMTAGASAAGDAVEGFRLYRSAAAALLRYRQALVDAALARQLEASFGREPDWELGGDPLPGAAAGEAWRSPLPVLASPPSCAIKWLNGKELARLGNALGTAEGGGEDELAARGGGLAGNARFDMAFWLTLLRADVFGGAQASAVARLRRHTPAAVAIAEAMAPVGEDAYTACAAGYAAVSTQLRLEALAGLAVLMEAGAAEAVLLLRHLGGAAAVAQILGRAAPPPAAAEESEIDPHLRETIGLALKTAIAAPGEITPGPARDILIAARAAARDVNRTGFRREDRGDAAMLAGLRSGAAAVLDLMTELDRIVAVLRPKAGTARVEDDRRHFLPAFERIYCGAPDAD